MVRIRLTRMGAKNRPFYRVVVADSRARRDGPFKEIVGWYDPLQNPPAVKLDAERIKYWISKGAQPSDSVKRLMQMAGL